MIRVSRSRDRNKLRYLTGITESQISGEGEELIGRGRSKSRREGRRPHRKLSNRPSPINITNPKAKKAIQLAKILLPHVGLPLFLFGFLCIGGVIFQVLEQKQDWEKLQAKSNTILGLYQKAAGKVANVCALNKDDKIWQKKFFEELKRLSQAHEGRRVNFDTEDILDEDGLKNTTIYKPRWTFIESVLYSISILTTTGYNHVSPLTVQGKVFAVVYGLFGIPIMFLTAVNIGRFLSESVMFLYKKYNALRQKIRSGLGRRIYGEGSEGQIRTRLLPKISISESLKAMSLKRRLSLDARKQRKKPKKKRVTKLPLWVNASILLLFCTLGAVFYTLYIETPFLDAFFIAFNLVANLTMEEMERIDNLFSVLYVVLFVSFGVAVLSMCADLASLDLKWMFRKIHYFGRKMRRRRRRVNMEDPEVRELLKIITLVRKKHPEKEQITTKDILDFIYEMEAKEASRAGQASRSRSGSGESSRRESSGMRGDSEDVEEMRGRRGTLAFIPESMEGFKYADEMEPLQEIPLLDQNQDDDKEDPDEILPIG